MFKFSDKPLNLSRKFTGLISLGILAGALLFNSMALPVQPSTASRTNAPSLLPPPPLPIGFTEQEPNNAPIPSTAADPDTIREIRRQGSRFANGPVPFNKRIVGRMGREDDDADWFYFDMPNVVDPLQIALYFGDTWGGRTRVQLQVYFKTVSTKDGCDHALDPRFYQSDCVLYTVIGDGKNSAEFTIPNASAGRYYVAVISAVGDRNRTVDYLYDLVILTDSNVTPPVTRSGKQFLPAILANVEGDTASSPPSPATTPVASTFSYTDDFSNATSGWNVQDDEGVRYAYTAGEYEISVKQSGYSYWDRRTFGLNPKSYTIEVDTRRTSPGQSDSGDCGLVFDNVTSTESNGVYMFRVDPSYGGFLLARLIRYPSTRTFTPLIAWTKSDAVRSDNNRIAVSRSGSNIRLFINDVIVGEANDAVLSNPSVGVIAGSDSAVPTTCRFDNFKVYDGPKPTFGPTPTPRPTTDPSLLDYLDDFSSPGSGWPVSSSAIADRSYQNGEYEVKAKQTGYLLTSRLSFNLKTQARYTLEIDVRFVDSQVGEAGLNFGQSTTSDNRYIFTINPADGTYRLAKVVIEGGYFSIEDISGWVVSSKIKKSTNRLKVIHEGAKISLFINDQLVNVVNDASQSGNIIGMTVNAFDYSAVPMPVRFDNFRITGTRSANLTNNQAGLDAVHFDALSRLNRREFYLPD